MTDSNSNIGEGWTTIELPAYVLTALQSIVEAEGLSSIDEAIVRLLIRQ